ncbi:unnamed protein product [Linum trigynum]|uniref:Cystatin domain-containing protein n=1 Tax=Linum trigynum TaxID=586398 RepID=A0AAV2GK44_9ROSI
MKNITFLVTMTTFLAILSTTTASWGSWQPIKNLNDENVKEIAGFAVQAYDEQASGRRPPLKLLKVESGQFEGVAGGKDYLLTLTAVVPREGSRVNLYETIVYENVGNQKKLLSFKKLL